MIHDFRKFGQNTRPSVDENGLTFTLHFRQTETASGNATKSYSSCVGGGETKSSARKCSNFPRNGMGHVKYTAILATTTALGTEVIEKSADRLLNFTYARTTFNLVFLPFFLYHLRQLNVEFSLRLPRYIHSYLQDKSNKFVI